MIGIKRMEYGDGRGNCFLRCHCLCRYGWTTWKGCPQFFLVNTVARGMGIGSLG